MESVITEDTKKRLCVSCETRITPGQEYETIITARKYPDYRHINYLDCSEATNQAWHSSPSASFGMISC